MFRIWKKHSCKYNGDEAESCKTDIFVIPSSQREEFGAIRERTLEVEEGTYFEDMGSYTDNELEELHSKFLYYSGQIDVDFPEDAIRSRRIM